MKKWKYEALKFICLSLLLISCTNDKLPVDIQSSLDRATDYIDKFQLAQSRLPTRDEYRMWWKTNNIVGVVDYQIASESTNDYELYIWLGERTVIYSSKTKLIREP